MPPRSWACRPPACACSATPGPGDIGPSVSGSTSTSAGLLGEGADTYSRIASNLEPGSDRIQRRLLSGALEHLQPKMRNAKVHSMDWHCALAPRLPGCWNAACTNTSGLAEALLKTRACGGCGVARYCCTDCQRASWRAGHKQACARLKGAGEKQLPQQQQAVKQAAAPPDKQEQQEAPQQPAAEEATPAPQKQLANSAAHEQQQEPKEDRPAAGRRCAEPAAAGGAAAGGGGCCASGLRRPGGQGAGRGGSLLVMRTQQAAQRRRVQSWTPRGRWTQQAQMVRVGVYLVCTDSAAAACPGAVQAAGQTPAPQYRLHSPQPEYAPNCRRCRRRVHRGRHDDRAGGGRDGACGGRGRT